MRAVGMERVRGLEVDYYEGRDGVEGRDCSSFFGWFKYGEMDRDSEEFRLVG